MAKTPANDTTSAGIGHNEGGLNDDQAQALAFMHRRSYKKAMEAKKASDAAVRNLCKLIKSEMGDDGVLEIKTMIESESEEGRAKVEARAKAISKAMAWAIGDDGQLSMFDGKPAKTGESKAYLDGKIAGMDDEPARSPYNEATADGEDWLRGHAAGKAVLDDLLKMRAEPAAELIRGSDDEDLDDAQDAA